MRRSEEETVRYIEGRTAVLLLTLLVAVSAYASESSYRHASFEDGYGSLATRIEFPDVEGDVMAVIYCFLTVDASGAKYKANCLRSDDLAWSFPLAVENAVDQTTVVPAIVEGVKHTVEIYFRAVIKRENGIEVIRVFPNWGDDAHRYGLDYQGAQRLITTFNWQRCTDRVRGLGGKYRIRALSEGLSTVVISPTGKLVGDVAFDPDSSKPRQRQCIDQVKTTLRESTYIPAEVDGEPVESVYVEVWGYSMNLRLD